MKIGNVTVSWEVSRADEEVQRLFVLRSSKVGFSSDPKYAKRFPGFDLFYRDDPEKEGYSFFIWPKQQLLDVCELHGIDFDYEFNEVNRVVTKLNETCQFTGYPICATSTVTFDVNLLCDPDAYMYLKLAL